MFLALMRKPGMESLYTAAFADLKWKLRGNSPD